MRTMERFFPARAPDVALHVDCGCIGQRRTAYDARRAKRLRFGTTGGAVPPGERIPDRIADEVKSHVD
ncbi:MAG: hypothetical protein ACYC0F_10295 [Rhodanobacter sp.]